MNAWAAKLERDSRAARLWFEEQQAALAETAAEPGTVVLQDEAVRRKAESVAAREQRLAELDAELDGQRGPAKVSRTVDRRAAVAGR